MSDLSSTTTIVVGASRGLGRGRHCSCRGRRPRDRDVAHRGGFPGAGYRRQHHPAEVADAGDAKVGSLLGRYEPKAIILVAGASPHMRPLQAQTWETFSVNWQTDVRITFHWLREALLMPLRPGSRVVVFSGAR